MAVVAFSSSSSRQQWQKPFSFPPRMKQEQEKEKEKEKDDHVMEEPSNNERTLKVHSPTMNTDKSAAMSNGNDERALKV